MENMLSIRGNKSTGWETTADGWWESDYHDEDEKQIFILTLQIEETRNGLSFDNAGERDEWQIVILRIQLMETREMLSIFECADTGERIVSVSDINKWREQIVGNKLSLRKKFTGSRLESDYL